MIIKGKEKITKDSNVPPDRYWTETSHCTSLVFRDWFIDLYLEGLQRLFYAHVELISKEEQDARYKAIELEANIEDLKNHETFYQNKKQIYYDD